MHDTAFGIVVAICVGGVTFALCMWISDLRRIRRRQALCTNCEHSGGIHLDGEQCYAESAPGSCERCTCVRYAAAQGGGR